MTPNTLHSVPGTSWGVKGLPRYVVFQAILRRLTLYIHRGILDHLFQQLFFSLSYYKIFDTLQVQFVIVYLGQEVYW
jgi:hypothetical protein